MKKLVLFGIIVLFFVAGSIYIFNNKEDTKQIRVMKSFLNAYYSNDNNDILPASSDPEEIKTFNENAEELYKSLYTDKYSKTLTFDAFETLVATRKLFSAEKIVQEFNCSLALDNAYITKTADTHDGRPSYSYTANIKVVFPDGKVKLFLETGSFTLRKENKKWLIDFFITRGELYTEMKKQ